MFNNFFKKEKPFTGMSGFGGGFARFKSAAGYISASGGTKITSGNYYIHVFTASNSPGFDISELGGGKAEVLVVAGGGGGGSGGGGAGGLVNTPITFTATGPYPITVGTGGNSGNDGPTVQIGTNGGDSWIGPSGSKITPATGGGAAGVTDGAPTIGNPGGSGGGAGVAGPDQQPGGTGIPGQGYPGGSAYPYVGGNSLAGGGGGAGGAGENANPPSVPAPRTAGAGGDGLPISWMPASYGTPGPTPGRWFAGGGGGGTWGNTGGAGGAGGGGNGGSPSPINGGNGTVNTGGAGGGAGYPPWGVGGTGGPGIVAIRYIFQ
jgi:hypothetical protein